MVILSLAGCAGRNTVSPGVTDLSHHEVSSSTGIAVEHRDITRLDPETGRAIGTESVVRQEYPGTSRASTYLGKSVGPGLDTLSEKATTEFKSSAPKITLPGAMATGADADTSSSIAMAKRFGLGIIAGVVCLIAAGAAFYFGLRRAALILAAIGALMLILGLFPELLLWGCLACVVGLAGCVVYEARQGRKPLEALRANLSAIADMPTGVQSEIDLRTQSHATGDDLKTILETRLKDGIAPPAGGVL